MLTQTFHVNFEKLNPKNGFDAEWEKIFISFVHFLPQFHNIIICEYPIVRTKVLDNITELVNFFVHTQSSAKERKKKMV